MSVSITGGYTISFTIANTSVTGHVTGFTPVHATTFPTYGGAYIGNDTYTSTPGKPALYQNNEGGTDQLSLSNIAVTDSAGAPVSGFGFVVADAENSAQGEKLIFSSNQNLANVSGTQSQPICGGGLTGVGTTTVTCTGASGGTGALLAQANDPSNITAQLFGGGLQPSRSVGDLQGASD